MAGLNYIANSINTGLPSGTIGREVHLPIGSIGTGWFVNRVWARLRVIAVTEAFTLPTNNTYSNWPQFIPFQLGAGVQSGASGYTPVDPYMANILNPAWWVFEECSNIDTTEIELSNPPYAGLTYIWSYTFNRRFGYKPQAAASDWYFSLAYDTSVPVIVQNQFYAIMQAKVTYG